MPAMPSKKPKNEFPKAAPMIALIVGLALSAYNLSLMTSAWGRAEGLDDALTQSQRNYVARRPAPAPAAPVCEAPKPSVLFSVVRYRDGEEAALRANLADPLLAYYGSGSRTPLQAVLIERKNAASRDVNVRLFFADGTETTYLWPSTHAKDGVWTPPDAMNP